MDIENLQKQLGARFKALRLEKGLTQEDIENFGFSYRHYGKIERGQVNLTLKTMLHLSKIFEVSLSDLFSFMEGGALISEQQELVATKVCGVLKEGNQVKLQKLQLFLDEIL